MNPAWSYILTALGITGLILAGSKKRLGWLLGLAAQPLWVAYALVSGQWGFVASGLIYGGVYLRNWYRWRREARIAAQEERWSAFGRRLPTGPAPASTVPSGSHVWHVPPWRTFREQQQDVPHPLSTGQQVVASAVKPPRVADTFPPPSYED